MASIAWIPELPEESQEAQKFPTARLNSFSRSNAHLLNFLEWTPRVQQCAQIPAHQPPQISGEFNAQCWAGSLSLSPAIESICLVALFVFPSVHGILEPLLPRTVGSFEPVVDFGKGSARPPLSPSEFFERMEESAPRPRPHPGSGNQAVTSSTIWRDPPP